MLARHAENMFWAGRYLERAEDTSRMVEATLQRTVSSGPTLGSAQYRNLLSTLRIGDVEGFIDSGTVLEKLVTSSESHGSIIMSIGNTRENLRSLREQVPSEMWEQVNRLHLRLQQPGFTDVLNHDPFAELSAIRLGCQTLSGIVATAMARGEGYRFFILGQMIERALMTCRLVAVRAPDLEGASYEETALTLRSASALEAYQRAHRGSAEAKDIVKFLLLSTEFPRALLFCLRESEQQLSSFGESKRSHPGRIMGQQRSALEYVDFDDFYEDLQDGLHRIESGIRDAASAIALHFFRNAEEFELHSQLLAPGVLI